MGWWMSFGFGNRGEDADARVRERIEAQERQAQHLADQVRRIDQALEVVRRRLEDERIAGAQ